MVQLEISSRNSWEGDREKCSGDMKQGGHTDPEYALHLLKSCPKGRTRITWRWGGAATELLGWSRMGLHGLNPQAPLEEMLPHSTEMCFAA